MVQPHLQQGEVVLRTMGGDGGLVLTNQRVLKGSNGRIAAAMRLADVRRIGFQPSRGAFAIEYLEHRRTTWSNELWIQGQGEINARSGAIAVRSFAPAIAEAARAAGSPLRTRRSLGALVAVGFLGLFLAALLVLLGYQVATGETVGRSTVTRPQPTLFEGLDVPFATVPPAVEAPDGDERGASGAPVALLLGGGVVALAAFGGGIWFVRRSATYEAAA